MFGILHDSLENRFSDLDNFEYFFGLFYTVYSAPNLVLPFFGGVLINKFGMRPMYFTFSCCIFLGQFICFLGSYFTNIWVILIGRFVTGIGGECNNSTSNMLVLRWFYRSEMSVPLAFSISVMRLFSFFADIISPRIMRNVNKFILYFLGCRFNLTIICRYSFSLFFGNYYCNPMRY